MTISHMAMNVGHQVFLNNCWGLKCTIGRTKISSLNTASQQLHSGVKVIQRSGCKQNDRVEKYLWSVPFGKRLRFWPKHPLLTIKYGHCSAHIMWPLPCLWAVKKMICWTLGLYVAGELKPTYNEYKTREFPLSFVTKFQPMCENTMSPHFFQLFHRGPYHIMTCLQGTLKASGGFSLLSYEEWGKSANVQDKSLICNSSGQTYQATSF